MEPKSSEKTSSLIPERIPSVVQFISFPSLTPAGVLRWPNYGSLEGCLSSTALRRIENSQIDPQPAHRAERATLHQGRHGARIACQKAIKETSLAGVSLGSDDGGESRLFLLGHGYSHTGSSVTEY